MWKIGVMICALYLPIMASESKKLLLDTEEVLSNPTSNEKMESLLHQLTHEKNKAHTSAIEIVKQFIGKSMKYIGFNVSVEQEYCDFKHKVKENMNKLARRTTSELSRENQRIHEQKEIYSNIKKIIDERYKRYLVNPSADELNILADPESSPVRIKRHHTIRRHSQEWVAAVYGIGKRSSDDDEAKRATEKVLKTQYDTTFHYKQKFEKDVVFYKNNFLQAYRIATKAFEDQDYLLACDAIKTAFDCAKAGVKNLTHLTQEKATKDRMDRLVQNKEIVVSLDQELINDKESSSDESETGKESVPEEEC